MIPEETVATHSSEQVEKLRKEFEVNGQSHLFQHFDRLECINQRAEFLSSLKSLGSIAKLNEAFKKATEQKKVDEGSLESNLIPPRIVIDLPALSPKERSGYFSRGIEMLRGRKVAIVTLAGGQGSRLGSSAPKGCYDIGLPSHSSLFKLQAERIKRLQVIAKCSAANSIPWFLMTSNQTHESTVNYFEKYGYFGLSSAQIHFFKQGELPAFSFDGKILLEAPGKLFAAPDGNGGIYTALKSQNILEKMKSLGIEAVHMYCVDNCLVKPADPTFIGICSAKKFQTAVKSVPKAHANESVGIFVENKSTSALSVLEYSEIPNSIREAKNSHDKSLIYSHSNIANHYFTLEALYEVSGVSLPLHVAKKKINFIDPITNIPIQPPSAPNGIKLEAFIFDVLPLLPKSGIISVERSKEFSPLKNATGSDSPLTSRNHLMKLHAEWLLNAGAKSLPGSIDSVDALRKLSDENELPFQIEVSPKISYEGEELDFCSTGDAMRTHLQDYPIKFNNDNNNDISEDIPREIVHNYRNRDGKIIWFNGPPLLINYKRKITKLEHSKTYLEYLKRKENISSGSSPIHPQSCTSSVLPNKRHRKGK